ncbi:gluconate 2-dehydrogenase subunit 3 family protein [Emticicia sp. CRIBPO]|uniref:gluconate 2-dehydrogenase subunit 3 family protein n=1 Tax=Emticicia sp. CRIBPO TaxID=2683258 RepID=UPI00141373BE|nr:gluconate 2-dehydrogenase subunit 3 family protein [Emticicia sp. CRIBPO]NBA86744.1 gluconate 2-dehydrogenase subunit 3 family protein [Emticicia sp. CRIBPO]
MDRREAIQRVTLMLGGVMSAPLLAGAMGQAIYGGESIRPTVDQASLIAEVADIIIPTTDTPGAKAAGVEQFIIRVMRDCYEKPDQEKFFGGLAKLDADSKAKFKKGFADLSLQQKNIMIQDATVYNKDFFVRMRELTITGYFISEIGATQALAYLPIPGRFDGCIPLEKDQKTWAL